MVLFMSHTGDIRRESNSFNSLRGIEPVQLVKNAHDVLRFALEWGGSKQEEEERGAGERGSNLLCALKGSVHVARA